MTKRSLSWGDEIGLIAKADRVADELRDTVACDAVYISLVNRERLYSFGLSGPDQSNEDNRKHEVADTVCAVTIERNAPQDFPDARDVRILASRPYVAGGGIVGYLGKPIRDADANAIGAICLISSRPRDWSDTDRLNLKLSCMEAEYLLATELLKQEMSHLSAALGEYDEIIMSLTTNIKLMTSVHGSEGELLFATNALLEEIDATQLEEAVRQFQSAQTVMEHAGNPMAHDQPADIHMMPVIAVKNKKDEATHWHATVQNSPGSVAFVSWRLSGSDGESV